MSNWDVIIVGGGVNGLACGSLLAKNGLKVLVAERNPWVGGGSITREVTLPGFKHDLFGSSHVWIHCNQDFNELRPELEKHGLKYLWAEDHITGHPNQTGDGIIVYKDVDKTCASIAQYSENDARRYREIYDEFVEIKDGFLKAMFSPPTPPSLLPSVMENSPEGLKMLRNYALSAKAFVRENFENPHVQTFILGWALAPQILPDQEGIGQTFYIMIPAIHVFGESIPQGGTMELPRSMCRYIEAHGGKVLTHAPVQQFLIANKEAHGIRLEDGREFQANKAVVTGLDPKISFLKLIEKGVLEEDFLTMVRNYSHGTVTICRVHYALHEAPKFKNGTEMNQTLFQRIFGSMEEIDQQYQDIAQGIAPTNPFLWTACWTLKDPTRAPTGKHTLIMDTFVPIQLRNGKSWEAIKKDYVDQVLLKKLQEYTTNMTANNILAEYIETGTSLEAANPCFLHGNTTGGERTLAQLGYFRPFPGYSQYRSPIAKLYMTGPYCHPGGGISAMGTITANVMLEDFGLKEPDF